MKRWEGGEWRPISSRKSTFHGDNPYHILQQKNWRLRSNFVSVCRLPSIHRSIHRIISKYSNSLWNSNYVMIFRRACLSRFPCGVGLLIRGFLMPIYSRFQRIAEGRDVALSKRMFESSRVRRTPELRAAKGIDLTLYTAQGQRSISPHDPEHVSLSHHLDIRTYLSIGKSVSPTCSAHVLLSGISIYYRYLCTSAIKDPHHAGVLYELRYPDSDECFGMGNLSHGEFSLFGLSLWIRITSNYLCTLGHSTGDGCHVEQAHSLAYEKHQSLAMVQSECRLVCWILGRKGIAGSHLTTFCHISWNLEFPTFIFLRVTFRFIRTAAAVMKLMSSITLKATFLLNTEEHRENFAPHLLLVDFNRPSRPSIVLPCLVLPCLALYIKNSHYSTCE